MPDSCDESKIPLNVLRMRDVAVAGVEQLFADAGLAFNLVPAREAIPGSHWGGSEAGLIAGNLYYRADTPVHSVLHEGCHYLLMSEQRRAILHTDAGGTSAEENAVCYLQIVLSDQIPEMGRFRMLKDMDAWGYSFRLGSAEAWFTQDAEDAIELLQAHGVLTK